MEEVAIEIVNDPYNFTCLLKKYFERVDEANLSLKRIIASSSKDYSIPPTRLKPEMACVAPYIEEGNLQHYRAQVLSVEAPQAQVIFVDYGNIQDIPTNELKYLPAVSGDVTLSGDVTSHYQITSLTTSYLSRVLRSPYPAYSVVLITFSLPMAEVLVQVHFEPLKTT